MRYLAAIPALLAVPAALQAQTPSGKPILPLRVVGTRVVAGDNTPIVLRGVNAASLEWTSDGEGHILETVRVAIQDWKSNVVRIPLSQDRWFGKAPEQTDGGQGYRALVKQVVDRCASLGAYVMLDLHWSNAGVWGRQIGQHVMPDKLSVEFWKDCAAAYRNHPAVVFDLYNEPHDVTWDVWLNGGTVTENDRQRGYTSTFEAVGMQALLDAVRSTGAMNLVVVGGLDWAYDMSGFLEGKTLKDPRGRGVLYANHNYPFKGDTFDQWLAKMKRAAEKIPITVSEFGAGGGPGPARPGSRNDRWIRQVIQALQDNGWHWQAWDLHPAAGPTLISDWNYTPTPSFGAYVKQALAGTLPRYTPPAEDDLGDGAAGPPVPQVAATVLDRAIAALGGEAALRAVKAGTWKTATRMTFNNNTFETTGTVTFEGLDHLRQDAEGQFGGAPTSMTIVVAGDRAERTKGDSRSAIEGPALAAERRNAMLMVAPLLLVPLKQPGFTLTSVPDATVDGRPAAGVRVMPPDKKPFTLYFDRETWLPVRMLAITRGFAGDVALQETLYAAYASFGDLKRPTRIVTKRDGALFTVQDVTEFRVLDGAPTGTFSATP